ncbi:MAG: MFS transporter, partial [Anaerolineae bacterium]|nr:MFS transporter [Anaerolineae bacterium]
SMLGSRVTMLALPLTAVSVLGATPAQMGILEAAAALPALLLGLFAGAWADRHRRRPILIAANAGRAALLLLIPLAATAGVLHVGHLYTLAFLLSVLGLAFDVAYGPFLLTLVGRERIVEGNSKLQVGRSVAEVFGPGLAGGLVQLVTAPIAIIADVISRLISALLLWRIRAPEPTPKPAEQRENVWHEIGEGLRLVIGNPSLRAIVGCFGTISLFNSALEAIWLVYLMRGLEIKPGLLGLISACGGGGFLIGALLPDKVARRFGLGPSIIGGVLLLALSDLLTPLAGGSIVAIATTLVASQFFFGIGLTVFDVGQTSLWQAATPDPLQGRVSATMQVFAAAIVPLGGLLGGALGEVIGPRSTLIVAALGEALSVVWLLFSPVRSLRRQPE